MLEYEREIFPYLRERSVTEVYQGRDGASQTVGYSDAHSPAIGPSSLRERRNSEGRDTTY